MSLYDQLNWGSFLIKSCHLLKLSYFVLNVWQLLLYFSVEKYGIYFCCLLSLRSYKERQVCVYIYIHTWMFMCTVSHTQINVVGKPLPLFPVINGALAHPRLQPHWTFGPPCPNLFPCIKKLQTQPNKTPSSITTKPGDTWGTKQLQTEIIYICPLRGPFLMGPFSPTVVPLPTHRASKVSSCSPTHEALYFSGGVGREWWWWAGRGLGTVMDLMRTLFQGSSELPLCSFGAELGVSLLLVFLPVVFFLLSR